MSELLENLTKEEFWFTDLLPRQRSDLFQFSWRWTLYCRSPMLAMFNLLDQWPSNVIRPILVGDRASVSFNSLTILDRNDWMAIFSLKRSFSRSPGFLIPTYCCKNGTIAVCNQEGFVISFRRNNKKPTKERVQMVFTNAAKNLRLKNSPHIDLFSFHTRKVDCDYWRNERNQRWRI